ncbi:MAG: tRNA (5-methylaminomethyl-2-thiouridine)(34)-methyltransferase MnmD [Bacteroidia bacterium]|nr:tRNA (5-methylaminomethyl-2-thiouridine)(34)-methyltransferase MnmD [Bacteroidia bacterium]
MNNPSIISNPAGLKTLFQEELNETYHSIYGAYQESKHVFIASGLHYFWEHEKPISTSILEIGFGTGLNAMLSLLEAREHKLAINYHSYETLPLSYSLVQALEYQQYWSEQNEQDFKKMHECEWDKSVKITNNFELLKINKSILNTAPESHYHLIYFDAFAPNKQAELWSEEVFKSMFNSLYPGGILVTYTAKGEVRRTLKSVGFEVERIDGPPGKRHMLRARKPQ